MTDDIKSLLIDAAKAAGIDVMYFSELDAFVGNETPNDEWNPHLDDGDSARLRTALEIGVNWRDGIAGHVTVTHESGLYWICHYGDYSGDKNAALRMATLRLAAEIWRARQRDSTLTELAQEAQTDGLYKEGEAQRD